MSEHRAPESAPVGASDGPADGQEPRPAWLIWIGGLLLLALLLFAAFSIGVYLGERGLTRPTLPPWPEPPPRAAPAPTLPPLPTPQGSVWPGVSAGACCVLRLASDLTGA